MGMTSSSFSLSPNHLENERREKNSKIWFLLHRTWTIVVTERWMKTHANSQNVSDSVSNYDSQCSQFTFCTCSQCQRDGSFRSSRDSQTLESDSSDSMAPNSEESLRIQQIGLPEDTLKEKQRPPIYNPEDYALSLKKWGKKSSNGGCVTLYPTPTDLDAHECSTRVQRNSFRDYRNPMLISSGAEMTLRQFGTVTELLAKLNSDLRLAYPSFVQEFVGDPLDGVTLLLDLLRGIQMSQSVINHQSGSSNTTGKISPAIQRRALLDELSCLQCLLHCCQRYPEALRKLSSSSAGLFTLAICIMSNVTKSRILGLELLTKACSQLSSSGHSAVSEALSTLRLRFGEPVRFRFLVGMLMSARGQGELLVSGMKFLNAFLATAGSVQKQLYIQAELEQAGFDVALIKENIGIRSPSADQLFEQLDSWEKKFLDVENLSIRLEGAEKENDVLRDKILLLERRVQILLEEKGILISLEQCLKERCSELQEEVLSLKSEKSRRNSSCNSLKRVESPPEDEGISSSEQSSCNEDGIQCQPPKMDKTAYKLPKPNRNIVEINKSEEETTIDDVIEELQTIVHNVETETYKKEQLMKERERKIFVRNKHLSSNSYVLNNELEIVPSNLHPQPPRRSKSLIHLFIPAEDYDYGNKELFFENETNYSSQESTADSLLSTSKYHLPRLETDSSLKYCNQQDIVRDFDLGCNKTLDVTHHHKDKTALNDLQKKSKSLDRIDDGLDTLVSIIVTDHKIDKEASRFCTKSDSGNITGGSTCLSRSMSNIFAPQHHPQIISPNNRCSQDENLKILIPSKYGYGNNLPYYFPRIQERRHNSFLIRRGHSNAGLYSGQIANDHCKTDGSKVVGKVTDLPCGLY